MLGVSAGRRCNTLPELLQLTWAVVGWVEGWAEVGSEVGCIDKG